MAPGSPPPGFEKRGGPNLRFRYVCFACRCGLAGDPHAEQTQLGSHFRDDPFGQNTPSSSQVAFSTGESVSTGPCKPWRTLPIVAFASNSYAQESRRRDGDQDNECAHLFPHTARPKPSWVAWRYPTTKVDRIGVRHLDHRLTRRTIKLKYPEPDPERIKKPEAKSSSSRATASCGPSCGAIESTTRRARYEQWDQPA